MSPSPVLALIGPAAAGKSTLGVLVAERLCRPFVDLDDIASQYYAEVGWSLERLAQRIVAVGRVAAEREWEVARCHAVERGVAEFSGSVLALGAGHTSFTDLLCRARVRTALRPVPNVFYIVPDRERSVALRVLRERSMASKGTEWICAGHDFLAEWYDDPGSRALAHAIVVTADQSPEETAARITSMVVQPTGGEDPT